MWSTSQSSLMTSWESSNTLPVPSSLHYHHHTGWGHVWCQCLGNGCRLQTENHLSTLGLHHQTLKSCRSVLGTRFAWIHTTSGDSTSLQGGPGMFICASASNGLNQLFASRSAFSHSVHTWLWKIILSWSCSLHVFIQKCKLYLCTFKCIKGTFLFAFAGRQLTSSHPSSPHFIFYTLML